MCGVQVGMPFSNCLELSATIFGIWRSGDAYMQMSALGGPRDFRANP